MFQRLRFKLTLINVTIMLALFLLLIGGTYFFAQINFTRHTESVSKMIASDIQAGLIEDLPQRPTPPPPLGSPNPNVLSPSKPGNHHPDGPPGAPPRPDFFFVKISPSGSISFQSSNQPLSAEGLQALIQAALQAEPAQATITLGQTSYAYFKAPLFNQPGMVMVFHDLTQEINLLHLVLTVLIAVGLVCSILSFGASFYMANRAMLPIKKAWQQQHDFLSDASHELRTPLTVIQTNLDIIKTSMDETVASQGRWLDNIQEESKCMAELVNGLLFLARADSKQLPLNKQLFSLDDALITAAAPFEAVALRKGLILEIEPLPAVELYGDENRLKQVIAILLDNACRHTAAGGSITVSLKQDGRRVIVTIADSGEGIAPEHLEKIFDRFYQADSSRNKGGSGLGLAIAKWIIESHGGSIAVTSTREVGSTFTIKLPLTAAG